MNDLDLDDVYVELCRMLQAQGEAKALPALARFALLAMHEIGDAARIRTLINSAASA